MPAHDPSTLPAGPLLAYYGDDFTGSTDVLEAVSLAGIPTVLFLREPSPAWLARFRTMRCVGLAGSARGRSPQWMQQHLPRAFASLQAVGAPILQYKVCSTFDSSPQTGSIGTAIELGVQAVGGDWSPMIVGTPRLKRYQCFGHLFAAMGDEVHRLDRHPTMSRHPVTPMPEADLRVHLAQQTERPIRLIDLVALQQGLGLAALDQMRGAETPVVLLDVVDEATLAEAGRLVWERRGAGLFSASSSGLAYALVAHWRQTGLLGTPEVVPCAQPVSRIAAISGSCSPVTASQIAWAAANGFQAERLDVAAVLHDAHEEAEVDRVLRVAERAWAQGRSPLIHSATGPDDPSVAGFADSARRAGLTVSQGHERVGQALARTMRRLVDATGVRRIAIAGGDSAGAVASALDITALTLAAPLAPGAPLCRAHSDNAALDGLELVLKGGQMGGEDFFGRVLGTAA
jgi:3-oxoisoapionate kinase